jgi:hypothetical protein
MASTDDSARWDAEAESFDEAVDHGVRDVSVRFTDARYVVRS